MSKLFWFLSIITIPLLMVGTYRLAEVPLTHVFVFLAGMMNYKNFLNFRIGKIEKSIYVVYLIFIAVAFYDLLRTPQLHLGSFFFGLKLLTLLIIIKFYSFFLTKFGINYFLKWLAISSGIVLLALLFRSMIIFKAPFFVVDSEQITESGKNQTAFYLALIIPCIYWFLKKFKMKLHLKLIVSVSLIIHLFSAIYVQSKGLLLALIASLGLTAVFYSSIKIKIRDLAKIALIALVPLYLLFSNDFIDLESFGKDINSLFSAAQGGNSSSERMQLMSKSYYHFSNNPLFGIGTNNFAEIERKATHNNYLQILAENGIFGFIIFIAFISSLHLNFLKIKKDENSYFLLITLLWALTIYLLVINGFFNAVTTIVFALIIYYEQLWLNSNNIQIEKQR